MKCKIILELAVISGLSFFASGNGSADTCVQFPEGDLILKMCRDEWKIQGKYPSNDTSYESRHGDMHCFTKCLYEKMGIFYDHQFHLWAIKDIMTDYVHHPLSKELEKYTRGAAEGANEEDEDDCEMADAFWEYNNSDILKDLKHAIFCDIDPWLNPE